MSRVMNGGVSRVTACSLFASVPELWSSLLATKRPTSIQTNGVVSKQTMIGEPERNGEYRESRRSSSCGLDTQNPRDQQTLVGISSHGAPPGVAALCKLIAQETPIVFSTSLTRPQRDKAKIATQTPERLVAGDGWPNALTDSRGVKTWLSGTTAVFIGYRRDLTSCARSRILDLCA
jgi:hypothetical protein